jgi:hypothetical protein
LLLGLNRCDGRQDNGAGNDFCIATNAFHLGNGDKEIGLMVVFYGGNMQANYASQLRQGLGARPPRASFDAPPRRTLRARQKAFIVIGQATR